MILQIQVGPVVSRVRVGRFSKKLFNEVLSSSFLFLLDIFSLCYFSPFSMLTLQGYQYKLFSSPQSRIPGSALGSHYKVLPSTHHPQHNTCAVRPLSGSYKQHPDWEHCSAVVSNAAGAFHLPIFPLLYLHSWHRYT